MGLRINTNVEAFNAYRNLSSTSASLSKSLERLSSGLRINRAADDAAGLAISEKMRAQIGGLAQAQRNAQDAVSLVQTGEGALNEVHSILQRVRDLKVQYDSGVMSDDDKKAIAAEVQQLGKEVSDIAGKTEFNGLKLLGGTSFTFTVGANSADTVDITTVDLAGASGVQDLIDVGSTTTLDAASGAFNSLKVEDIDDMITNVSTARSTFGAVQNRLDHRLNNLATYQENLVASESRIRDVDMASEMVNFTKLNILQQAGTSMLAQANQAPQGVLSLLRG
jgi:flagellin